MKAMGSTCVLDRDQLGRRLHPEALFSERYQDCPFDPRTYTAPQTPWRRAGGGGSLLAESGGRRMCVEAAGEGVLRIRYGAGADFPPSTTERLGLLQVAGADRMRLTEAGGVVTAKHGVLSLRFELSSGNWSVRGRRGRTLIRTRGGGVRFGSEPAAVGSHPQFLAAFDLPPGDVFGGGGRIAPLRRRAGTLDVYAVKVGHTPGDYGGFPLPLAIWPNGTGVFLNNPWPHVYFDFGASAPDQWWVHAPGGDCDWFVIEGGDMPGLLRRFTSLVGRIPPPKRWWLGFWTSALAFSSAAEVEEVGRRLRREGYPCDALVIDGPWRGGPEFLAKYMQDGEYPTNNLNWHPDFGDGPAMVRANASLGYRTVLHQNSRSYLADTIARASDAGEIRVVGREAVPTFGTEAGERFYAEQVRPRHAEGIGMWWLDHGDRVSGELLPGVPSRNLFGAMWARATRRCAETEGCDPTVALVRGAGIGGQSAGLPWPGDTRFGIGAFIDDVRFVLAAGLAGFPITSVDLGGFMRGHTGEPGVDHPFDRDNLARRFCQGILVVPSPRMHQSDSHPAKLPWNCPPEIQALYRAMLLERYRLTPYWFSWAIHAARTGEPVVRPIWYRCPDDPRAVACEDEVLIGDSLLAAPVFRHGAVGRSVYLPSGQWHCWWTGRRYAGGRRYTVPAPLYEPRGLPLFVKSGSIVPRQEPTVCLPDEIPAVLTLDVFAGCGGRFDCHESDSVTHRFACEVKRGKVVVRIPNRLASERIYRVRLHLRGEPRAPRWNGKPVQPGLSAWDPVARVLTCTVRAAAGTDGRLDLSGPTGVGPRG
jgi:alpha-D-xyloside xylohydrolase